MPRSILRFLYSSGLLIYGILTFPHLLKRLRQAGEPWRFVSERLGRLSSECLERIEGEGRPVIWVHAVSVGEVHAVSNLVLELAKRFPSKFFVLSTVTPTGYEVAQKIFCGKILVFYFPIDWRFSVRRVFLKLRPQWVLLTETEIWPNFLEEARRLKVPVWMVNGRISGRAFRRYHRVRFFLAETLASIEKILARSEEDAGRFMMLGIAPEKVAVTGNLKFDRALKEEGECSSESLKKEWGMDRLDGPFLVAGSTHAPEERLFFRVYRRLQGDVPGLKLIVAPRHIERVEELERECERLDLASMRLSHLRSPSRLALGAREEENQSRVSVFFLDAFGELANFYLLADLVWMGGSFLPHGGQNPIEPAWSRRAILFGPHVFNFSKEYELLEKEGAAALVEEGEGLYRQSKKILLDENLRMRMGEAGHALVTRCQGATRKTLAWLLPRIETLREKFCTPREENGFWNPKVFFLEILEGENHGWIVRGLRLVLILFSLPYGVLVRARRSIYRRRIRRSKRLPIPVVSVGNLTWGGTGKTMLTQWLAKKVGESGLRPLVLTRGYADADEAPLLREEVPKEAVGIGKDRYEVALRKLSEKAYDLAILDDGFQHLELDRDVDILLVNARSPFGNGHLLPAGSLREPISSLRNADILILSHVNLEDQEALAHLRRRMADLAPRALVAEMEYRPLYFERRSTGEKISPDVLRGKKAVVFSGIGAPHSFESLLEEEGLCLERCIRFEDHHRYTTEELGEIAEIRQATSSDFVVTTEKDFFRDPGKMLCALDPWVLKVGIVFRSGEKELLERVFRIMARQKSYALEMSSKSAGVSC